MLGWSDIRLYIFHAVKVPVVIIKFSNQKRNIYWVTNLLESYLLDKANIGSLKFPEEKPDRTDITVEPLKTTRRSGCPRKRLITWPTRDLPYRPGWRDQTRSRPFQMESIVSLFHLLQNDFATCQTVRYTFSWLFSQNSRVSVNIY